MTLSVTERVRYRRHLMMPEVGATGQERLKAASVLVVGAGGLGSPVSLYLAAAGVGRLGLVDFDVVDESNLQRQILFGVADLGRSKLVAAEARLRAMNPEIVIESHPLRLEIGNARSIVERYDLIVDGSDNYPTRYLVNDVCVEAGKPLVYGAISRFEGQATVFDARTGPCYRCLFPQEPGPDQAPNCADGGVIGVLPGVIGTILATEAVKLILERGTSLSGRLLLYDALEMTFRELRLRKDPLCPVCSEHPMEVRSNMAIQEMSVVELKEKLDKKESLQVVDVREMDEWEMCRIEGAKHIPLHEIAQRSHELDKGATVVLYCHHGRRSQMAAMQLQHAGFPKVWSLAGGINAWACEIDSDMATY